MLTAYEYMNDANPISPANQLQPAISDITDQDDQYRQGQTYVSPLITGSNMYCKDKKLMSSIIP